VEGGRRQTGERGSGGHEAREPSRQEMSVHHRLRRQREQGPAGEEEEEVVEEEELEGACEAACAMYFFFTGKRNQEQGQRLKLGKPHPEDRGRRKAGRVADEREAELLSERGY